MGKQRPGAPPEEWEERRDDSTRVVISHIDKLERDLEMKLKGYVRWETLAGGIVALLALVWALVTASMSPTKEAMSAARAEARERVQELKTDTASQLERMGDKLERVDAKLDAMVGVTLEGQSRGAAKAQLRRRTAEPQPLPPPEKKP